MITVEMASKILTKNGLFTTEENVRGKIIRGFLFTRTMTDHEKKIANTKYNYLIDEDSFDKYLEKHNI